MRCHPVAAAALSYRLYYHGRRGRSAEALHLTPHDLAAAIEQAAAKEGTTVSA